MGCTQELIRPALRETFEPPTGGLPITVPPLMMLAMLTSLRSGRQQVAAPLARQSLSSRVRLVVCSMTWRAGCSRKRDAGIWLHNNLLSMNETMHCDVDTSTIEHFAGNSLRRVSPCMFCNFEFKATLKLIIHSPGCGQAGTLLCVSKQPGVARMWRLAAMKTEAVQHVAATRTQFADHTSCWMANLLQHAWYWGTAHASQQIVLHAHATPRTARVHNYVASHPFFLPVSCPDPLAALSSTPRQSVMHAQTRHWAQAAVSTCRCSCRQTCICICKLRWME
jgi:hypothetical protein